MESSAWVRIVAEELMVPPEKVQSLAAAAREVGCPLSAADLIAAGARAGEQAVSATRTTPREPPERPEVVPTKLRWDRLLPWR